MKWPLRPQFALISPGQGASSRLAWLAWSLATAAALVSIAGFVSGITYAAVTGDASRVASHIALNPFLTIAFAAVGALVASRHPRNAIGWIFLTVGVLLALIVGANAYEDFGGVLVGEFGLPGSPFAAWLDIWFWAPAFFLPTIFLFFLFPDGRLLSPRWRLFFWSAALGLIATVIALALHPGPIEGSGTGVNPYGIPEAAPVLDLLYTFGYVLLGIGFVGAVISFILRWRRSKGIEREQMKWLLYALLFMILGAVVLIPLSLAFPDSAWVMEIALAFSNLTLLVIAAAASVAILRYRLYDIDLIINRTLVYGALTVIIVVIYVLIVGGLGAIFQTQGNTAIALAATGLVAVLFQPMRERLQRAVNRLFYGQRDDPLDALSQLGRRMEATIDPNVVLPTLVETIAQTLKLPYAAIALRTGEGFGIVAQSGDEVPDSIRLPLVYQGETVGQLIAGQRGAEEPFSQSDRRLLENIAHQSGPAVHAVQLTAALQHSRLQLVTAREEERRRLRRDLHDGLGATLAALNLEVGALKRSIRTDPEEAEAVADELRRDIRATIEDIRRLVYELRPPTLDQLGLVAAVRAQAIQCARPDGPGPDGQSRAALQVEIDAPEELPTLPAAVEVAAYRIAQEALTNVVHHAQAQHCLVRLQMSDALIVEIVDDGVGLAIGRMNGGVGLLSMRERALELGGTCLIEPAPGGGTRVLATLPLLEA